MFAYHMSIMKISINTNKSILKETKGNQIHKKA